MRHIYELLGNLEQARLRKNYAYYFAILLIYKKYIKIELIHNVLNTRLL